MSLASIAKALGGAARNGAGWVCRCPVHEDKSPSLSLRMGSNGELLVHCFTGCDWKSVKDELKRRGLMNGFQIKKETKPPKKEPPVPNVAAQKIWTEAVGAHGTLGEYYLHSRGYKERIPTSIRFHPELRHPNGGHYPALVAALGIWPEHKVYAVHRIYLDKDGNKLCSDAKLSLGPVKCGAVHLAPHGSTLALTEGIETGLSVMQATGLPVWSCLTAGGIESVIIPDTVDRVIIYADNDRHSVGEHAAFKAARRLMRDATYRTVQVRWPNQVGSDYNDLLKNQA